MRTAGAAWTATEMDLARRMGAKARPPRAATEDEEVEAPLGELLAQMEREREERRARRRGER